MGKRRTAKVNLVGLSKADYKG
ncbi:hypothetical protein MNBD_CHLOROFLEXI01-2543, partial [hydrothermal vent metagenome]